MGDESWVISQFERSVHGKPLTRVTELRRIVNGVDWSKPLGGSTNIRVMALGALAHAGKEGLDRFDAMFAGSGGWGLGGNEQGSWRYEQGWTAPVIASFAAKDEGARRWSLAFLAEHALSTVPFPSKLRAQVNKEASVRDIKRWGSYQGPLSILPGSRYVWDWPSRRPSAPEIERGLANPILQNAIDAPGRRWNQWKHRDLGWGMEALFGKDGHRYRQAPFLADPESRAFLGSFSKAAARPLVSRLDQYPLRPERWVEWRFHADGSRVVMMRRSTHHTRGPCQMTIYDPVKREVLCATASRPRGGGEWYAVRAKMNDTNWECQMNSGDQHLISGPLPSAELDYAIRWTDKGCRIVGDDGGNGGNGGNGDPDPDPRVIEALSLFSQVAVGSGDPWIKQGIETAAEVMRRITLKKKPEAIQGSRDLTIVLER